MKLRTIAPWCTCHPLAGKADKKTFKNVQTEALEFAIIEFREKSWEVPKLEKRVILEITNDLI